MNPINIPNPLVSFEPGSILSSAINLILVWGAAAAVLFVIFGGFRYVISMGNQESVERARNTVLYAILGLIIMFLAYAAISYLLSGFLQVKPAYQIG